MAFSFSPMGYVRSCFKEKFGIPRQSGLAPDAIACIEIVSPYDRPEAFRGLEDFSHIWIVFVFHENIPREWKATVRPPRLGGNKRRGVFSTRSGFRPNPVGISVVKLERIERCEGRLGVYVKGGDLLDGTPVLDIKPYLPYVDQVPSATAAFASEPPAKIAVTFSPQAEAYCAKRARDDLPGFRNLLVQLLEMDPRPAYQTANSSPRKYGMRIFDVDVKWEATEEMIHVLAIIET